MDKTSDTRLHCLRPSTNYIRDRMAYYINSSILIRHSRTIWQKWAGPQITPATGLEDRRGIGSGSLNFFSNEFYFLKPIIPPKRSFHLSGFTRICPCRWSYGLVPATRCKDLISGRVRFLTAEGEPPDQWNARAHKKWGRSECARSHWLGARGRGSVCLLAAFSCPMTKQKLAGSLESNTRQLQIHGLSRFSFVLVPYFSLLVFCNIDSWKICHIGNIL